MMKRVLILSLCLLMIASVAWGAKPTDKSKKAFDVLQPLLDPSRPISEGFEGGVPPAGWFAVVNNPYTWTVGTYNPQEGLQYADCQYDASYSGPQDEWIGFNYTMQAGDAALSFYSFASIYWAITPYQNYNLYVYIDGTDVWNYYDDNNGATTWAWQQYVVDLTSYSVGQTIEIKFGYTGYDGAEGAFDAISIGEAPVIPVCPFQYPCYVVDFNQSDGGFKSQVCGLGPIPWQWGVPTGIPALACDGVPVTHVLGTVLAGTYPVSKGEGAVIGPFDITPRCTTLELCHFYDTESGYDGGNVKVSTDAGATWQLITPIGGYDGILTSTYYIPECVAQEAVFYGTSTTFVRDCFDISDYVGDNILVGFFFGSESYATSDLGWYIKWVKIGTDAPTSVKDSTWGMIKALYR
jgi:hypothetical protein